MRESIVTHYLGYEIHAYHEGFIIIDSNGQPLPLLTSMSAVRKRISELRRAEREKAKT